MIVEVDSWATTGRKLLLARKAICMTQMQFSKLIKVSQPNLSDYERDVVQPGDRIVEDIIRVSRINESWWNTGEGEILTDEGDGPKGAPNALIKGEKAKLYLSQLPDKEAENYIPYYDVEITAGKIELYFDDVEEIPEGYIYAPQYRNCIACNVKGDSMYEKIYPGARLYVYHLKNKKYIDFGQIYLIVIDGYRLLKYIDPDPKDESRVILRSHNREQYKDWPIEKADILNLFLVKGFENQNAN
jgi:phage repressor protein C with HTH and peptisase S24 domain